MSEKMAAAYRRGARAEAQLTVQGMTPTGRQVYDYVRVCAAQGRSAERIAADVAFVFTSTTSLRERLALAWRLVSR